MNSTLQQYWSAHPDLARQASAEGLDLSNGRLPLRAVLFDMDGVLFDSMPAHAKSWAKVCHDLGLQLTEIEAFMHEGRTAFSTINWITQRQFGRGTTEEEVNRIYALKCEEFNHYPEAPKMPGAVEVLQQVAQTGLDRLVVTGSGQASLLDRLTTNYPGCFGRDKIVSSKDTLRGKPHPDPYLLGLQRAGALQPWQALVVENAPLGVQAAVTAGIFTIAVNTGPLPESALAEAGANLLFPSMTALAEAWPKIIAQLMAPVSQPL